MKLKKNNTDKLNKTIFNSAEFYKSEKENFAIENEIAERLLDINLFWVRGLEFKSVTKKAKQLPKNIST